MLMFHVVYLSFEEKSDGRMYIGKHSSNNPYDSYLGSYYDKDFNPSSKIILEYCKTEQGAVEAEMRWQRVFKVADDTKFANKSYQTSKKFIKNNRGENHPMYGKPRPDVRERNQRDNPAKRKEVRDKMSKSRIGNKNGVGKLWWVNRAGNIIGSEVCPSEDWQRGRIWRG